MKTIVSRHMNKVFPAATRWKYPVLFLLFCFLSSCKPSNTIDGKVVGISDGDTFTMLVGGHDQIKVRLYGVDCPELGQPFGNAGKKMLAELVFQQNVQVVNKGRDRHGRMLGIVYAGAINVNEKLLDEGLAWHYKKYDGNTRWANMEKIARSNKKGLWADSLPIPPWEWRRKRR